MKVLFSDNEGTRGVSLDNGATWHTCQFHSNGFDTVNGFEPSEDIWSSEVEEVVGEDGFTYYR